MQVADWEISVITQYDIYQILIMFLNKITQNNSKTKNIIKFIVEF